MVVREVGGVEGMVVVGWGAVEEGDKGAAATEAAAERLMVVVERAEVVVEVREEAGTALATMGGATVVAMAAVAVEGVEAVVRVVAGEVCTATTAAEWAAARVTRVAEEMAAAKQARCLHRTHCLHQ